MYTVLKCVLRKYAERYKRVHTQAAQHSVTSNAEQARAIGATHRAVGAAAQSWRGLPGQGEASRSWPREGWLRLRPERKYRMCTGYGAEDFIVFLVILNFLP